MVRECRLGIDCGSVSLNLVLLSENDREPVSVYKRTRGRPLQTFVDALRELIDSCGEDLRLRSVLVTGSGRELIAEALQVPAINEISAHSAGALSADSRIGTIIEIGGQDSKFIRVDPSTGGARPRFPVFRMNEICAAGTGAFLDEQSARLGIPVESFGSIALQSNNPAAIAGRCAVFAKTDMIHKAQEGIPLPDILMGLALALARNYIATLVRGEPLVPVVSLQGGVMNNAAVVHAFKILLDLKEDEVTRPRHFDVLGALGCAVLAGRNPTGESVPLRVLLGRALANLDNRPPRSSLPPLRCSQARDALRVALPAEEHEIVRPLVMGLDVGSVSVKGVLVDSTGRILKEDYRLSRSRNIETLRQVMDALNHQGMRPEILAVTGSGRYLAGRLVQADLIVNEITAQARAALSFDDGVDTVVEIGGQDSKWIALEHGTLKDFEMNRVCAAGTGSFLMEQADRLGLEMGREFSDAALASQAPADLGNRCTVFMESDLIHHQNNGATCEDLAAGVCVSIVQNYLERVMQHKPLGRRILFLGGVAANPAVRAAFEAQTGLDFRTPDFFRVSGALGAALKALDSPELATVRRRDQAPLAFDPEAVRKDQFRCAGCANGCLVDRYHMGDRTVFHGGLCDRWEVDQVSRRVDPSGDLFKLRTRLLEEVAGQEPTETQAWGVLRSPQSYEWLPFWKAYADELGISIRLAGASNRKQFEQGLRYLKVETCLPVKALAGQASALVDSGIDTIFNPTILTEEPALPGGEILVHCPYIQATSQFFRESFNVEWKEPLISYKLDPQSFQREHVRFARELGFSSARANRAIDAGLQGLEEFRARIARAGEGFLDSLDCAEPALVVLGKPYHTADSFLNMNLGSLFQRLGIRAVPSDLYPLEPGDNATDVAWKYHLHMIRVARAIARDDRLFPVLLTFFGCGPDPFTVRHLRPALCGKPLLVLEMDEHTSRAGLTTRIEAYLEYVEQYRRRHGRLATGSSAAHSDFAAQTTHPFSGQRALSCLDGSAGASWREGRRPRKRDTVFLPYFSDHSYGFAAAARAVGVDAKVLPPPDEESERLGRPHLVGGECHPYALILGDYLKFARSARPESTRHAVFYILGPEACRLRHYSVYMEMLRRDLGYSLPVVSNLDVMMQIFGMGPADRRKVMITAWEGLNAYDLLQQVFLAIRPLAEDPRRLGQVYVRCREKLFEALANDRAREGIEQALHELYRIPLVERSDKPVISVTGDYYTRIVPFANNDVYLEIERLGGIVLPPPTFSDAYKMEVVKDFAWAVRSRRFREAAQEGLLYMAVAASEFKVKGGPLGRTVVRSSLDLLGLRMWKSAGRHVDTRLPGGITAPLVTALHHLNSGADGVLNLIALNCSYGTVVTASLSRALRQYPGVPMLTLVYDGLKKTNERTRLEAFMEQVHDHFGRRTAVKNRMSTRAIGA